MNQQAATFLKFAKATSDPEVALGSVEKAADLKDLDQGAECFENRDEPQGT